MVSNIKYSLSRIFHIWSVVDTFSYEYEYDIECEYFTAVSIDSLLLYEKNI